MIWVYVVAFVLTMGIKSALYRAVGFEYNVARDGFSFKKLVIDFAVFFVIYLVIIVIFSLFLNGAG